MTDSTSIESLSELSPAPVVQAFSPEGLPIVGTLERVLGVCPGVFECQADGTIMFEPGGETKLWWDSQETVSRAPGGNEGEPHRVFLDENMNEWLECDLIYKTP